MTAPSPGILTRFIINLHYPNEEAYVEALAEVMKTEYKAIVDAGFVLQIDAPDLGSARNNQYRHLSDDEFRTKIAERNIAALNAATEGLPADKMRLHICWGNYEGPHTHDLPVTKIIDIAFKARMRAISIEAANPRHDHEWEDLKEIKIPDDKILIPGVIDSTTNFVEHPRLVAQRIERYAQVIDRERLIAGVDCGFGTSVRSDPMVADSIVWAKLAALSEGAGIASRKLWDARVA
jgi:5-methyltetrahydropteroyltriglutamate--homocysteine methyltransferase